MDRGQRAVEQAPRGGRAEDRLRALRTLMTGIVGNLDLEATTLGICNAAQDSLGADAVGIMTLAGSTLEMRACVGHRNIAAARFHAARGEGVAGIVLQTGRPYSVDDFESSQDVSDSIRALAQSEAVRCSLGAPLLEDGRVTGVILAWSRTASAFDDHDREVLEELAHLAAIAITNAQSYERAQSAIHELAAANERLQSHNDLLSSAREAQSELTELMLRGEGLTALANLLSRYTHGDVIILDAELSPLSFSAGCEHLIEAARGQVREARRRKVLSAGSSPSNGLVFIQDIVVGGDCLAHLWASLPQEPDDLMRLVIEQGAVVSALELTKQRAILDARVRLRSDFLWDLVEGKIGDAGEANVRARYLGFSLPRQLRVVVVRAEETVQVGETAGQDADALDRRRAVLLSHLEHAASEAAAVRVLSARRGPEFVMITPSPEAADRCRDLAYTLHRVAVHHEPNWRIRVGASANHDLGDDLSQALSQARTALSSTSSSNAPVAVFEDLGILRFLLAPSDRDDLENYVERVLGPVIRYDRDHSTELIKTISAHLTEDSNLSRTAARLFVHPKTVRYRLDRVAKLVGRDFNSQQDCFDVQLALRITEALGTRPPPV